MQFIVHPLTPNRPTKTPWYAWSCTCGHQGTASGTPLPEVFARHAEQLHGQKRPKGAPYAEIPAL